MSVLETDIQFSDRAKGVGRSLRIITDSNLEVIQTRDPDNNDTVILTINNISLKNEFTGTGSDNTPEGAIIRAGGKHATKNITLNANATTQSINVFQVTGATKITLLHGEILTAAALTSCSNVYFDLWDGTTSIPLTKTTGAGMGGYNVGSFFIKDADVASVLSIINNNTCKIKEAATGSKVNTEFIAIQKTATNTYIRFNYSTTDAPINATLKIDCQWSDIDSGVLTAV